MDRQGVFTVPQSIQRLVHGYPNNIRGNLPIDVETPAIGTTDKSSAGISLGEDVYGSVFQSVITADTRKGWVVQESLVQVEPSSCIFYE